MPDAIITINQTFLGEPFTNVVCFNNLTEDAPTLIEFADLIRLSYEDNVKDAMVADWTLESIDVSFLLVDSIDYTVNVPFTAGALVGESINDGLPPNAPLLISTSYIGSRPNRGRIYFSGLSEVAQNNGIYNSGTRQQFEDLVQNWTDGLPTTSGTHFLRILRRPSDVFPSYVSSGVSIVSSRPGAKNQRRRSR